MTDCAWVADSDGTWSTGCGNAFVFIDGGPAENGFRYCCYCGGALHPTPYSDDDCDWCDSSPAVTGEGDK